MGSGAKAMGQRSRKIVKTVTEATPAYTATVNIRARENATNRSAIDVEPQSRGRFQPVPLPLWRSLHKRDLRRFSVGWRTGLLAVICRGSGFQPDEQAGASDRMPAGPAATGWKPVPRPDRPGLSAIPVRTALDLDNLECNFS